MDEDTEGMQGTILYLQTELRQSKERIARLTSQLQAGQGGENADPCSASFDEREPEDDVAEGDEDTRPSDDAPVSPEETGDIELEPGLQANGDAVHDLRDGAGGSVPSKVSARHRPLTNGRKRTQSDRDDSCPEEGDAETVEGLPVSGKRTRTEIIGGSDKGRVIDGGESADDEVVRGANAGVVDRAGDVLENGFSVE